MLVLKQYTSKKSSKNRSSQKTIRQKCSRENCWGSLALKKGHWSLNELTDAKFFSEQGAQLIFFGFNDHNDFQYLK